jgi:hypothetical protein
VEARERGREGMTGSSDANRQRSEKRKEKNRTHCLRFIFVAKFNFHSCFYLLQHWHYYHSLLSSQPWNNPRQTLSSEALGALSLFSFDIHSIALQSATDTGHDPSIHAAPP